MNRKSIAGGVVHKLPADLRAALRAAPKALAAWREFTPLARNEWICWISSPKKPETRVAHRASQRGPREGQAPAVLLARLPHR
jgi:Bacteriocin-protection, YdeI or OmpD-Associated